MIYVSKQFSEEYGSDADLLVIPMVTTHNNNDSPRQSEQPSQDPNHVHFLFHACLLAAHHCSHPAAFDLVLGEAVVTVFVVDTIPRQSEQPSQDPNHVHFLFHACLLAAHHCSHPAAFDLVL